MITPTQPFHLISPNIKRYIEDKKRYLTCNPQYFIHVGSLTKSNNHKELNRHSVGLEMMGHDLRVPDRWRYKQKEQKRCERQLNIARSWALAHYEDPLDLDYISSIGRIIEPLENKEGLRRCNVKVTGSRVSPPSGEKVLRELKISLWENETLEDPLEKAIHAHYSLARVHPFQDGNGRTARLVQDSILWNNELPCPAITLPERTEYISRLEEAVYSNHCQESSLEILDSKKLKQLRELASEQNLSSRERTEAVNLASCLLMKKYTPEQSQFYDFIALKVLTCISEEIIRLYPTEKKMKKYLRAKKHKRK